MPEIARLSPSEVLSAGEKAKLLDVRRKSAEFRDRFQEFKVDDEFHRDETKPKIAVGPLRIADQKKAEEVRQQLENMFDYYSQTGDPEINTPKTGAIQRIIDRMASGYDVQTRVVVLRKGEAANAFVVPDGTVFVTQSLINKLKYEDELASVLAHELGHLLFDTSGKRSNVDIVKGGGVSWVHETACDARSASLLEKSGYNSFEFSNAITKVAGTDRGVAHQTGLTRASQMVGQHFMVDYETSSQALKPLSEDMRDSSRKTNLEIALKMEGKKEVSDGRWRKIISNLYPSDFKQIYNIIHDKIRYSYQDDKIVEKQLEICNQVIIDRLKSGNFSEVEVKLFFLCLGKHAYGTEFFKTPQDPVNLIRAAEGFENSDTPNIMYKLAFGAVDNQFKWTEDNNPTSRIVRKLDARGYVVDFEKPEKGQAPITQDSLVDCLEQAFKAKSAYGIRYKENDAASLVSTFLYNSALRLATINGQPIDPEYLKVFFTELKNRGVAFSFGAMIRPLRVRDKIFEGQEKHTRSLDDVKVIGDAFKEVYGLEKSEVEFDRIDKLFEDIREKNSSDKVIDIAKFIETLRKDFDEEKITDSNRIQYLDYIYSKINSTSFPFGIKESLIDLTDFINHPAEYEYSFLRPSRAPLSQEERVRVGRQNEQLIKLNLGLIIGRIGFDKDGDEFYGYIEKVMHESGIDPNNLNQVQLTNICNSLVLSIKNYSPLLLMNHQEFKLERFPTLPLTRFDKLFSLPFIRNIVEREEGLNVNNFQDLYEYSEALLKGLSRDRWGINTEGLIFGDTLINFLVGSNIEKAFDELLSKNITEEDYSGLFSFIDKFYPKGVQRDNFLRELNRRYLKSPDITLDQKTTYLLEHFDRIGPEGAAIIAEQIEDIVTFRTFLSQVFGQMEIYLEGGGIAPAIAAGDFASSFFTQNFEALLKTTNPANSTTVSTSVAENWFGNAFGSFSSEAGWIKYNKQEGRFELDSTARMSFRTLKDSFTSLKNLSYAQRFTVAHKSLTDKDGALTSEIRRDTLAKLLVQSLGLKKGFVASTLAAAARHADAKLIAFPASNMLSSLLFRALDTKNVNYQKLAKKEGYFKGFEEGYMQLGKAIPKDEARRIIESTTRAITIFGAIFRSDPDSSVAKRVDLSDQRFFSATQKLEALLVSGEMDKDISEEKNPIKVDPSMEAVIKGVELSGALGIRALQLTSQFHHFSDPVMERRIAESLDSNPGIPNKLLFWYNLDKLAKNNPDIEQFVQTIKLKGRLGAGSLQTTYAATHTDASGIEQPVIAKLKNPNVERFIKEVYENAEMVLQKVLAGSRDLGIRENCRTGLMLIDLARNWCRADINDTTFITDDNAFRGVVDGFNATNPAGFLFAPERVLNTIKLKSEQLAVGKTVNQILQDQNVSLDKKQQVVSLLGKFFKYQMSGQTFTEADGSKFYLMHSDPHTGNYVADLSADLPRIGVIDRSMYLKIPEKDMAVFNKLISGGNVNDFVYSFVDRILERNKAGRIESARVKTLVFGRLAADYANQLARGEVNKLSLMQTMLTELGKAKMDIPLQIRLMVRNIGAMQQLMNTYDLNLQEV